MNASPSPAGSRGIAWLAPVIAGLMVLAVQLLLVSRAGTDVPFQDQWDVEGTRLYPAWLEGTLRCSDLWRAHNEHRIVWTHLLNLGLFAANGQWDPLVQMIAGAMVRAISVAGFVWMLGKHFSRKGRALVAGGMTLAFLPALAWHNALWGFQSQVYFVLLFSLLALALLSAPEASALRKWSGVVAGEERCSRWARGLLCLWRCSEWRRSARSIAGHGGDGGGPICGPHSFYSLRRWHCGRRNRRTRCCVRTQRGSFFQR